MKKIVLTMVLVVILTAAMFTLTGCTLQIETTERVDSIIDWIKARIDRVFNSSNDSQGPV